jgi:hypothetical protein
MGPLARACSDVLLLEGGLVALTAGYVALVPYGAAVPDVGRLVAASALIYRVGFATPQTLVRSILSKVPGKRKQARRNKHPPQG